jgi:uncharacterized membrane protein
VSDKEPMSSSTPTQRLGFADDARGVAVLLMILWHVTDAWLMPTLKVGPSFEVLRYLGSLAAPLFVVLSGAGAALKLCGDRAKLRDAKRRSLELGYRGLYVMSLGYALRVFMWVIDGKALFESRYTVVWLLCGLGLTAAIIGFDRLSAHRGGLVLSLLGVGGYVAGLLLLWKISPQEVMSLLRADVLQVIGLSLLIIALLDIGINLCRTSWIGLSLGLGIASITTYVESLSAAGLPVTLGAYLARFTDGPGREIAMFPLLPWLGYALVGVSIGVLWYQSTTQGHITKTILALLCVSIIAALCTSIDIPALSSIPPVARVLRMIHKVGLCLIFTGISYFFTHFSGLSPLRSLGKTSLLVYCVHLELVYGLCGLPWVASLGYQGILVGFLIVTFLMAALAKARLYVAARVTKPS